MEYYKLINEWHKKAEAEGVTKPFSAFVFEYLSFIALLKTELHKWPSDRTSIQSLKQDLTIKNKYLALIRADPNLMAYWKGIIEKLDQNPLSKNDSNCGRFSEINLKWWNCSAFHLENVDIRSDKNGVLVDVADWENMVEFWYAIRNNMFHGTKDPENERDQFLVESGYKTLKPLMDMLLTI